MPEIRELLRDAAPSARPFDERAVRARVTARRRRRAGAGVISVVAAVAAATGLALSARSEPEQTVVAEPPAGAKVQGVTAVAVAGGDVWLAYEDGGIGIDGEEPAFDLDVTVRSLHADGAQLWALGDDGRTVAVLDVEYETVRTWEGEGVEDLEPLGDRRAAVSSSATGEIVLLDPFEHELVEVTRIAVGPRPTNLVLATDGRLWVEEADSATILAVDPSTGEVLPVATFGGTLLAASDDGRIWVGTERVVDLDPDLLEVGQSVAQGARYGYAGATMAVAAGDRLYVGGPAGIAQYARNDQLGMAVTADEPVSMAIDGEDLVYVAGGAVHRFDPERAAQGAAEETLTGMIAARQELDRFLREELRWPDPEIGEGHAGDAEPWTFSFEATTPALERDINVILQSVDGAPEVTYFWTFGADADDGSVALGHGHDAIYHPYVEEGLSPELTVHYGDRTSVFGADEAIIGTDSVGWEGDLGFVPDTPGWVQIVYRDADGVAVEGLRTGVPAGPFAAG